MGGSCMITNRGTFGIVGPFSHFGKSTLQLFLSLFILESHQEFLRLRKKSFCFFTDCLTTTYLPIYAFWESGPFFAYLPQTLRHKCLKVSSYEIPHRIAKGNAADLLFCLLRSSKCLTSGSLGKSPLSIP